MMQDINKNDNLIIEDDDFNAVHYTAESLRNEIA